MPDRPWKQEERRAAALFGGQRFPANTRGPADFETGTVLGQVKHVRRLSLAEIETVALAMEHLAASREPSKAGLVVVKRRAGPGRETPRLVILTETAWRHRQGGEGNPLPEGRPPREQPSVPRPAPGAVQEMVRALKAGGPVVRIPVLAQALREQTGCSRAGAYRAIRAALASGVIQRG